MIKKLILLLAFILLSQSAFAIERSELNLEFFDRFNDECLTYCINQALNNNHELKKAGYVVEQYRQQAKYSLGKELPAFSVSANYLGIKVPRLDNFQLRDNAFILPFMANYEADLLLKNRDKTKSANKLYLAGKFNEKAVYIALLTDVATVYTNILQYDELIEEQKSIVEIAAKMNEYDRKKLDRGVIELTQYNNSAKNLEDAKNNLANLHKEQDVLLMQLAVLTGVSPDCAADLKRGRLEDFEYSGNIPEEICSDVIFSRPDVMEAEAKLESAKIDIRVARKEFLPNFNIVGIWAFNTIAPGTFFSWESSLAALMAGAAQDIFKGGTKLANLRIKKAKYEELFEDYRQTDLDAVKEVNTALCFIKHDKNIEQNTISKLNYETKNFNNSQKKLERGVIASPEYLENMNKLVLARTDKASAKTQRIVNYFTLYKAAGGKL